MTRLNILLGLALAATVAVGPALASDLPDGASRATLAAPAPKPVEAIIDGREWQCGDTTCTASPSDTAEDQSVPVECKRAAQWLGRFTAYQTGRRALNDAELAACNAHANPGAPRSPS